MAQVQNLQQPYEVTLASGTLSPVAQKTQTSLALAKQVLEIELDELKAVQSQLDA